MKKKRLFSLATILLSLSISGCFSTGTKTDDDDDKVTEGTYMGVEKGHYKVDSKGNRLGDMEDHVLVDSNGDDKHKPVAATCALPGKGYKKCTVCGRFVEYAIPKADHNWVASTDPAKAASCTRAGVEECSMCGLTRETGKPMGHQLVPDTSNIDGVTKEKCTRDGCTGGTVTLDISKAAGWNDATTKMNGKSSPNNKSTWNVAGVLEDGIYDIQIEGVMSYSSHGDRKWYNMAKAELCINNTVEESDSLDSPDTTKEDDYRYFFKVNDSTVINPTVKESWSDLGYGAETPAYGYICKDVTISGATSFCLYHGNIGFSMIISNIKLIKH